MAIAAIVERSGRRVSALNWRWLRQRLMPLLLLAFFCEVTLPYQADCQLYHPDSVATGSAGHTMQAMDDDCPMRAGHHAVSGINDTGKQKKSGPSSCSLCDLAATFVGAVATSLISLPPPTVYAAAPFAVINNYSSALPRQNGFPRERRQLIAEFCRPGSDVRRKLCPSGLVDRLPRSFK